MKYIAGGGCDGAPVTTPPPPPPGPAPTTTNSPPPSSSCGKPAIKTTNSRVIGGQEATPHSHPWQCYLGSRSTGGSPYCGCSIIDESWIVTAAHCVSGYVVCVCISLLNVLIMSHLLLLLVHKNCYPSTIILDYVLECQSSGD